jgi:hypothetical protein
LKFFRISAYYYGLPVGEAQWGLFQVSRDGHEKVGASMDKAPILRSFLYFSLVTIMYVYYFDSSLVSLSRKENNYESF